jgi:hypothetical protein
MEKLKKQEAFKRATEAFGEWKTWGRAQHLAYGLIRGVPYPVDGALRERQPPP